MNSIKYHLLSQELHRGIDVLRAELERSNEENKRLTIVSDEFHKHAGMGITRWSELNLENQTLKVENGRLRERLGVRTFALITAYDFIERLRTKVVLNEFFYKLSGKAETTIEEALAQDDEEIHNHSSLTSP